ncbi:hypothetical protein B484DRAFT_201225 [Ochromonadaceae sp. CCMP2298]|nr:hypothetical protein B484DRAFT_201225 [Ochromonadaceae sp. CCMP2298]
MHLYLCTYSASPHPNIARLQALHMPILCIYQYTPSFSCTYAHPYMPILCLFLHAYMYIPSPAPAAAGFFFLLNSPYFSFQSLTCGFN